MGKELKVLMMGGQRVGKSSALAAIMESFISGSVNTLLTAKDVTVLAKIDGERQSSIEEKLTQIKLMLESNYGNTILVDSGKTSIKWDYQLKLSIPDSSDCMTIRFTDVNGEFYESGGAHHVEVSNLVNEYDVFIIAIDTTYLMEASNKDNELVDFVINEKFNCVEDMHTFLTRINDSEGHNAKLVIFAPIKCEKWAKGRCLNEVTDRVKSVYKTTIVALEKYQNVQIEFLPIQTVGSIIFKEHLEAYIFSGKKRFMLFFEKSFRSKCSPLSSGKVRLSDGKEVDSTTGTLIEDNEAILIPDSDIMRPNSWFAITGRSYQPHNCEQLAFHILDFMLGKTIDAQIREKESQNPIAAGAKRVLNFILDIPTFGLWSQLKEYFGDIPIDKMQSIIDKMKKQGLIKYCGEGIEIYKKCQLKTL